MVTPSPIARVALAIPVRRLFDYRVPPDIAARVQPGMRVRVPFGRSTRVGYCIERAADSEHPEPKDVQAVLDEDPILDAALLRLVLWTADYYLASVGEVIESAIPRRVREERPRLVRWARVRDDAGVSPDRGAGKDLRARLVELVGAEGPLPVDELLSRCDCSRSPVDTLVKQGRLEVYEAPPPAEARRAPGIELRASPLSLSPHQETAVERIRDAAREPRFESFLLRGVTGSGKTEVYLRALETVLETGRGALVLLPEIALTPQTVARFRERCGAVAVLHSMLPAAERSRAFRQLRDGELRVAIGARSAIFAPIRQLGLIVVDECHESSYKQESAPRYHAADLAVVRASQQDIPCVLGSATPSLEQLDNTERGRWTLLDLPERVTRQSLARIEIVDRRQEKPGRGGHVPLLSRRLERALADTVERGEQAILLLNRRGFARHIHCASCGYSQRCRDCDIALTYHKRGGYSQCHYCGHTAAVPEKCPECSFPRLRRAFAGTERIEEVLGALLPGVAIGRLDRDTASTRDRMESILARFRTGELQVLVGTQMVAKGHDIPAVTLVGVIDADVALNLPDFRAAERTAQLLCQVAGRAGRGERPGLVLVQTRHPDHYAIEAARRQDPRYLYQQELGTRRLLRYPPFGHLVRILCEDRDEQRAMASARSLVEPGIGGLAREVQVLGPSPAPLARLRDRFRFHVLLKSARRGPVQGAARIIGERKPRWSTTKVVIDVDPQALL